MSLRSKLLLVALVTLTLPWAAWRFVLATEGFLRQGQEQALLSTARSIAGIALEHYPAMTTGDSESSTSQTNRLYVHRLTGAIAVDGYADDWGPWADSAQAIGSQEGLAASVIAGRSQGSLYLLIEVHDPEVSYGAADGQGVGDYLELVLSGRRGFRSIRLQTSAPGRVVAMRTEDGSVENAVRAEWQPGGRGYRVELQVPMVLTEQGLAIRVVDRESNGSMRAQVETDGGLWSLMERYPPLVTVAEQMRPEGARVWMLDPAGRVLAQAGMLEWAEDGVSDAADGEAGFLGRWWRTLVYRRLLAPPLQPEAPAGAEATRLGGSEVIAALAGEEAAVWRPAATGLSVVASAAVPVGGQASPQGVVVVEQASDALLLLTNQAISRLLMLTVAVMLASAIVLLLFASRLSRRIRQLRDSVDRAMTRDGEIREGFKASRAKDELGDLSRSFGQLLAELRGYNDYLRSLASRLSHELNTPLAVVRSSLENLDSVAELNDGGHAYLERAQDGANRLQGILRAMGEARRLEESLTRAELETFDLARLLTQCCDAYRDIGKRQIRCHVADAPVKFYGSPELIAQLLDKLVDNALSFTPDGGEITVRLKDQTDAFRIEVLNDGPPLPAELKGRLFDSMVSVRESGGERLHLGLGLHIVRLIAQFHEGSVQADNRAAGKGVIFTVTLPRPYRARPGPSAPRAKRY